MWVRNNESASAPGARLMGVYSNAVLADSPLHYWRFFENYGALAAQDIGLNTSYLYANAIPITGFGAGGPTTPGMGWSGPASDGGSCAMSGSGWKNFIPSSGSFPDPPGVSFPIPGTLEAWFWGGEPDSGTVIYWFFPTQPANQQFIGMSMAFDQIQAQVFGSIFVTQAISWSSTWHHCVMVMTSTAIQLYIDGSSVGTAVATLSPRTIASNFIVGQSGVAGDVSPQTGFLAELAIYNAALGAGQVANHHAAGDSRSNSPTYYGTRPATVPNPRGLDLGPAHLGLTGTGSISLAGGTVAALISVTTDAPQYGQFVGDPDYLTSRGYVTASNSLGSVYEFNRLVFGTQVRFFPPFTSVVSWSFPVGLVVSITELFIR